MLEKLKNQAGVRKLQVQYLLLPPRDQKALRWLVVALLAGFLYFALWLPATRYHDRAETSRLNAAQLLTWMNSNAASISTLAGASRADADTAIEKPTDSRALMALVTRSSRESGLVLQRFEPSGDNSIRIWMDNVPFADVASWLETLSVESGVVIGQAALEQTAEAGKVKARLTLGL
ncbi:type II secretion system protein GspM [Marinobacter sp. ELB17]|uniref:type II secretion system protein GspM n=1 Tax=Marinobacter sp. ELB17 TaxID=270374 RepID=UPI0000F39B48|nr:type II secretion system protein M [Marinobacter sp. ELB17]EAZ99879.1 Type II secretory pathway, component PulM [Marinobacter sp. ELB17]